MTWVPARLTAFLNPDLPEMGQPELFQHSKERGRTSSLLQRESQRARREDGVVAG
jgi:hypothetical protein